MGGWEKHQLTFAHIVDEGELSRTDRSGKVDAWPNTVQVEMTSRCNLKCTMCPLTTGSTLSSKAISHMSEELWRKVIEVSCRADKVIIAGFGEPLLNRDCFTYLGMLQQSRIKFSLSTNATLITPERAAALATMDNLIHINISIDSPDPDTYRRIRGGEVVQALNGVRHLMATGIDERRVTISTVMMDTNLGNLRDLPPMLAEMGIHHYVLQGLIDLNPNTEGHHLRPSLGFEADIEAIRQSGMAAGVECEFLLPKRLELELSDDSRDRMNFFAKTQVGTGRTKRCTLPWELSYIDKDGRVFPCCYAASSPTSIVGDLSRESFSDIWRGQQMEDFRARVLTGKNLPSVCAGCTAVPWGIHQFQEFAATIVSNASLLNNWRSMKLVARNTGSITWTPANGPRLATSGPRDRQSGAFHPTWLSGNRVCTMREKTVAPGELATYNFRLSAPYHRDTKNEVFQLMVEGVCWLPGTSVVIKHDGKLQQIFRRVLRRARHAGVRRAWG